MITSLLNGTRQKYKDESKVKVVILKTLPPSLEQAGSVLLPMVDYSLGGDGGGDQGSCIKFFHQKGFPSTKDDLVSRVLMPAAKPM